MVAKRAGEPTRMEKGGYPTVMMRIQGKAEYTLMGAKEAKEHAASLAGKPGMPKVPGGTLVELVQAMKMNGRNGFTISRKGGGVSMCWPGTLSSRWRAPTA